MTILYFTCIDPKGNYQEASYGGLSLEECFDAITHLVNKGWQFVGLNLLDQGKTVISLPAEAFDGQSLARPLQQLQEKWEQILV